MGRVRRRKRRVTRSSRLGHDDRIEFTAVDEYNKPGREKLIFLLTTRVGGLGINLTIADIAVLYGNDC